MRSPSRRSSLQKLWTAIKSGRNESPHGSTAHRHGTPAMLMEPLEGRLLLAAVPTPSPQLFTAAQTITAGVGTNPNAIATADFNADGVPDLAVLNYNDSTVSIYLGNSTAGKANGTFTLRSTIATDLQPTAILATRLRDSSSIVDLAITSGTTFSNSVVSVMLGNNNGTFGAKTDYSTVDNSSYVLDASGNQISTATGYGWGPDSIASGTIDSSSYTQFAPNNASDVLGGISDIMGRVDTSHDHYASIQAALDPSTQFTPHTNAGGGHVDLVTGDGAYALSGADFGRSSNTVSILYGDGLGHFGSGVHDPNFPNDPTKEVYGGSNSGAVVVPVGSAPQSVAVGDLISGSSTTTTPYQDIVTANRDSNTVTVLINQRKEYTTFTGYTTVTVNNVAVKYATYSVLPNTYFPATVINRTTIAVGHNPTSVVIAHLAYPSTTSPYGISGHLVSFNDIAVTNQYDNTVTVLINKGDGTFATGVNYSVGASPLYMIAGDFNSDGKTDLAVADSTGDSVSVLLNRGDGTFDAKTDTAVGVGSEPIALVSADFNGDRSVDLLTANFANNSLTILFNRNDGIFNSSIKKTYNIGGVPTSVNTGDFNGDGIPDLVATNGLSPGVVDVLIGNGDGTFLAAVPYNTGLNPRYVAVGDFNGDNFADLAIANADSNTVSILLGNGNGTFRSKIDYIVGTYAQAIAIGDFNRDGHLDLAIAVSGGAVSVLINRGDGTFEGKVDYVVPLGARSIVVGDFNNDGALDLAVASDGEAAFPDATVLLGYGDGTFKPGVTYNTGGTALYISTGYFNGDNNLDLILATLGTTNGSVSVLLGNGDGTFGAPIVTPAGYIAAGLVVGDFNQDGKTDVITSNLGVASENVLIGNGDGTFQIDTGQLVGTTAATYTGSIVSGYFDKNNSQYGRLLDAAIVSSDGYLTVLTNTRHSSVSSVTTSKSTLNPNESVTLTAVVTDGIIGATIASPSAPTGIVTFYDGTTIVGTAALTPNNPATNPQSSTATLVIPSVPGGPNSFTAHYSGDTTYDVSISNPALPVFAIYATTISVTANPPQQLIGQPVVLTASVSSKGNNPSGTVSFYSNGTLEGIGAVVNGVASITVSDLALGTDALTTQYSGDSQYSTSTSGTFNIKILQRSTTTLTASQLTYQPPGAEVLTATVAGLGGTPSGTIDFYNGTTLLSTADVINGVATLSLNTLTPGINPFSAVYSGDTVFGGSTSATVNVEYLQNSSTVVSALRIALSAGQSDTFTATVTGPAATPTGTVTFFDGTTTLGTATLTTGVATFNVNSLSVGAHQIRATYSGDAVYFPSSSVPITVITAQSTTTSVAASRNVVLSGQSETLTATITYATTGIAVTGTVTFYDGTSIVGTGTLPGVGTASGSSFTQTATLTLAGLSGGTHSFTAAYSGDLNYSTSTSAGITVEQAIGTGQLTPEYRLFSSITNEHFYTTDVNEYNTLATRPGWTQEGIRYQIFDNPITIAGVVSEAWYRLYNAASRQHFLTADLNEYNTLATRGWSQEGITGYIFATPVLAGTTTVSTPLYRLYNPASGGLHLWTTDRNEYNTLPRQGWRQEGIVGDVINASGF